MSPILRNAFRNLTSRIFGITFINTGNATIGSRYHRLDPWGEAGNSDRIINLLKRYGGATIYDWTPGKRVMGLFPCLKTQIHPLLDKAKKLYASRFYQLKAGHGAIGTFLERIGAVESAECWWCGDGEQSVMQLYTRCQKWRTERQVLKKSLDKIGIRWQREPEIKILAELLANEREVGPLLVYLKDTEVGSRESAVEQTMEWRRRVDQ